MMRAKLPNVAMTAPRQFSQAGGHQRCKVSASGDGPATSFFNILCFQKVICLTLEVEMVAEGVAEAGPSRYGEPMKSGGLGTNYRQAIRASGKASIPLAATTMSSIEAGRGRKQTWPRQ